MTLRHQFRRPTLLAAMLALLAVAALTVSGASPARADRCDDLAGQLKNQIDGLAVGKTAANLIYLSHPQPRAISLACATPTLTTPRFPTPYTPTPPPPLLNP